ncbi:MAG: hypothetical protein QXV24_00390 [Nitrososphaerota archaeon]
MSKDKQKNINNKKIQTHTSDDVSGQSESMKMILSAEQVFSDVHKDHDGCLKNTD